MDITLREENKITTVKLDGDFESQSANEFKILVSDLINTQHQKIILDFYAVKFMTSSALKTLLLLLDDAALHHCKIVVCELNSYVNNLFEKMGLKKEFRIFPTRREAKIGRASC